MRDLLQELTRTRKLVENIISRHRERGNMSPASTNGGSIMFPSLIGFCVSPRKGFCGG